MFIDDRDLSIVIECEEMFLDDEIEKQILSESSQEKLDIIKQRVEKIRIYRFVYLSNNHRVVGFLVEPKVIDKPLPCIFSLRGGSKEFGQWTPFRLFAGNMPLFAENGYIVITTQYSGVDGGEGKDEFGGADLDDVICLYDILRSYRNADVRKIAVFGPSRGGLMAYQLLTRVDWIKAVALQSAVANTFRSYELRPSLKEFHHARDMFDVESHDELIHRSPLFWPEKLAKNVPILIIHGTADNRVSVLDSIEMAAKLYECKVPYRLIIYEGADHYISEYKKEQMEEVKKWFERYLIDEPQLPDLELHGK